MKLAAIDIGSNSIHLVIVDAITGQRLQLIEREKEMVRLGAGTLTEHRLSDQTIDRAISALKRLRKVAEVNKVERIVSTATSAVRESRNGDEFVARVRREVDLDVKVLPGIEEARLISLAVSEVTDFNDRRALIIDIGGGSTEFIVTDGNENQLLLSVRLGAVRLAEKFIASDPISPRDLERLTSAIRSDLTRAIWEINSTGFDFVIGTSGTVLDLANAIVQAESPQPTLARAGIEPFSETVSLEQISRMNRRLSKMTLKQRSRVPGIERRRADIIIAGGALLHGILAELKVEQITTCDWALREGIILDYLRTRDVKRAHRRARRTSDDSLLDPDLDDSQLDVQSRSVLSVARRYGYDAPHSRLVARLAASIFDDTRELHEIGAGPRRLLIYSALLHDIGYHVAHNNHHRHASYLIKNSEMPGFAGPDIAMMAMLARYHRGSMPANSGGSKARREDEDYYALERAVRPTALKLAAILRIADGLDRSHRLVVTGVRCKVSRKTVTILVESAGECDLEIWSAERKALWFAEVFNVALRFKRVKAQEEKQESEKQEAEVRSQKPDSAWSDEFRQQNPTWRGQA
jgi:exopolyphosphatase/guanosine-5'-triphosphate,3'-diphosphate pyrophosphatase